MNDIILSSGMLEMGIAPGVGGCVAWLDWQGGERIVPVLRGSRSSDVTPLESGCFPLVPFCNRIGSGAFHFRGRTVRLAPNMAGDPSPIHGQGWQSPWRVLRQEGAEAVLGFTHQAGEWPWAYAAEQHFALDERGLSATLLCRNLSDEPMPCGLGFHPYFPCLGPTTLTTGVSGVWTVDENILPVQRIPVSEKYALDGREICGRGLDNGYDGWSGEAWIESSDAPFRLRLSSPGTPCFQLYAPTGGGLFVAEPVSHVNNALARPEEQWPELGLRILDPGASMTLAMRLDVIVQP